VEPKCAPSFSPFFRPSVRPRTVSPMVSGFLRGVHWAHWADWAASLKPEGERALSHLAASVHCSAVQRPASVVQRAATGDLCNVWRRNRDTERKNGRKNWPLSCQRLALRRGPRGTPVAPAAHTAQTPAEHLGGILALSLSLWAGTWNGVRVWRGAALLSRLVAGAPLRQLVAAAGQLRPRPNHRPLIALLAGQRTACNL